MSYIFDILKFDLGVNNFRYNLNKLLSIGSLWNHCWKDTLLTSSSSHKDTSISVIFWTFLLGKLINSVDPQGNTLSMTTHRQTTGRHDNSATAIFHRQPTRRHDHWPTRQVTDIFLKNSPTLADTHGHSPTETFLEKGFSVNLWICICRGEPHLRHRRTYCANWDSGYVPGYNLIRAVRILTAYTVHFVYIAFRN